MQNKRVELLIVGLLILITVAVFSQVRNHAFIGYDDDWYVTDNMHVQNGLSIPGLHWAFSSIVLGNWHPLTWLSHQLDVQLFGMNPGAHHLVNLFLHLLNTLLFFFVLKHMTAEVWQSCLVAVLFAIHPLHVESVAWIAERKDLLSGFFWISTMLCYVLYTKCCNRTAFLLTHLFFLLGLLSKPMLVTLPFVLLLLDYWPLKRFADPLTSDTICISNLRPVLGSLLREKTGLFVITFVFCLVTLYSQSGGGNVGSLQIYPFTVRVANALVAYATYPAKMLWPANLAVLYPHPGMPPYWKVLGSLVFLSSVTAVSLKYARKYPWLCVGWLWYLGTLVPVIGIVQVGVQSMADRYTYIPLVGLFVVAVWGGEALFSTYRRRHLLLFTVSSAVVLMLSVTAWYQVGRWSNSISLFQHALSVTDNNYIIHNNLGVELRHEGRPVEALAHYSQAIQINPGFTEAHLNIGVLLADKGHYAAAAEKFRDVVIMDPNFTQAHLNLGNNQLRQGYAGQALRHYADALTLDPDSADAYNGMGAALVRMGKYAEAIMCFRKALLLNAAHPEATANLNKTMDAVNKLEKEPRGEDDVQR